jgi:hypothetical protein
MGEVYILAVWIAATIKSISNEGKVCGFDNTVFYAGTKFKTDLLLGNLALHIHIDNYRIRGHPNVLNTSV